MNYENEIENEEPGQESLNGVIEGAAPVIEQIMEHNDSHPIPADEENPVLYNDNSLPNTFSNTDQSPKLKNINLVAVPNEDPASVSTQPNKGSANGDTEPSTYNEKYSVKPDNETLLNGDEGLVKLDTLTSIDPDAALGTKSESDANDDQNGSLNRLEADELAADTKTEPPSELFQSKANGVSESSPLNSINHEKGDMVNGMCNAADLGTPALDGNLRTKDSFIWDESNMSEGCESGTEEEQSAFMKELENFFRERIMEFKPPKFYGEGLNCLKLWRAVTRLGGYEKVTSCKLWRQVGESFKPPKTCTTVSWTFRGFYEKALLEYERHKALGGELNIPIASASEPMTVDNQASGSGRARRDAAARAMQGWHSQRFLGNGEVNDPIIKDRNSNSLQKRERQLKSIGLLKRKKSSTYIENTAKVARPKSSIPQLGAEVVDVGPPADWVKINVERTNDCFEVYALVPGLLREEVRVQSDPAGRLVISGEPEHPNNPWGVRPFKKVVSLSSRIDPHQTSAVVTLHGQLFVRVPFEQSD